MTLRNHRNGPWVTSGPSRVVLERHDIMSRLSVTSDPEVACLPTDTKLATQFSHINSALAFIPPTLPLQGKSHSFFHCVRFFPWHL